MLDELPGASAPGPASRWLLLGDRSSRGADPRARLRRSLGPHLPVAHAEQLRRLPPQPPAYLGLCSDSRGALRAAGGVCGVGGRSHRLTSVRWPRGEQAAACLRQALPCGVCQLCPLVWGAGRRRRQRRLTSSKPMVSSRQSSWLMLGVFVCSKAAMRRAPCRRAFPRGSSSTPMVVRIASFCKHRSTAHWSLAAQRLTATALRARAAASQRGTAWGGG